MANWAHVRDMALSLPETSERLARGLRQWCVRDRLFVWERPLRRADRVALGDWAPDGPILGARVEHVVAKEALLADDPAVFFTTPHFDGYPAILVRLERIGLGELHEVIVEAWLARAPERLVRAYLDASPLVGPLASSAARIVHTQAGVPPEPGAADGRVEPGRAGRRARRGPVRPADGGARRG